MDIALTCALGRAHAACQAWSFLHACRTLGLDGTGRAQRSYPWTIWDGIAQPRSQASRCRHGLAYRRCTRLTYGIPASPRDCLGSWDAVWQAPRISVLAALSASIAREPNAPTCGRARTGLPSAARWRRSTWTGCQRTDRGALIGSPYVRQGGWRCVTSRGCVMDIALTFARARANAACQASSSLDACRTLGLDGTTIDPRSCPWTICDRIAQPRSQASRCRRGLALRRSPWIGNGHRSHMHPAWAHAACQASSSLDACRTLGLDGTKMAQRSYPWRARTGLPSAARWRSRHGLA